MSDASKRGAANRRRGHSAERAVARYLRERGYVDAATTRGRLGHDGTKQPGDVEGIPGLVISMKDVAASAWPTWLRQARAEAEPAGLVPVVVRRTRGKPDVGHWVAVAPSQLLTVMSTPQSTWSFVGSCRRVQGSIRSVEAHLERMEARSLCSKGCLPAVALTDAWARGEWSATRFCHVAVAAERLVAASVAVAIANHQRLESGACRCGWQRWPGGRWPGGDSHAAHVLEAVRAIAPGDGPQLRNGEAEVCW